LRELPKIPVRPGHPKARLVVRRPKALFAPAPNGLPIADTGRNRFRRKEPQRACPTCRRFAGGARVPVMQKTFAANGRLAAPSVFWPAFAVSGAASGIVNAMPLW